MATYSINGLVMPAPVSLDLERNDLYGEGSGRDEAGYNHLDLVRANVRKYIIKHSFLTDIELNKILTAVNPTTNPGGFVFSSNGESFQGYVSSRKIKLLFDDNGARFWDLDFSVVEN